MNEKSLKANMLWNSAGSIYYSGCQWLITVLVARLSTSFEAAGSLAVAMSISNIFAQIGLFRIRSYQVSDVHEEVSSGEYVGFRLITISLGFAITVIYMVVSCAPNSYASVLLYLVFRAGDVFIDVLHGIDQQHYRMDYCGKSMLMRSTLFLIAFAGGMMLFNQLEAALLGMVLFTYPIIIYDLRAASKFSSVIPTMSATRFRELFSECLPAVLGMALCSLVVTYSRQYLGIIDGESALGVYSTVCTPIVIIQACVNYVYAPLLGMYAEYFEGYQKREFMSLLLKTLLMVTGFFIVCSLGFVLFGKNLFGFVFGPEIEKNADLIYAGLVASMMTALVAFFSDLLIALRDMRGCLMGNLAACAVSFPMTWYFVENFSMNGVSLAVSLSYSIGVLVLSFRLALRVKRIKSE